MSRRETSIDLPPPRPANQKPQNNILWVLITCVALAGGAFGGVWFGKKNPRENPGDTAAQSPQVEKSLAEARIAISESQWAKAGQLYQEVLEADPDNAEAKASIPLITKHLQEANGNLVIKTQPAGAKVIVPGREPLVTPAEINKLPAGAVEVRIEKNGFEPVVQTLDVVRSQTTHPPVVTLEKSAGRLELVSEPKGADFKVIKPGNKGSKDVGELVQIGKTPAKFDGLETGEYEVLMSVKGWPDYSQRIKVEHNRSSAVSAVFARGGINIVSDPVGAEVWASTDSGKYKKKGNTPLTLDDLAPGRHRIEVRYKNWAPIRRTVEVKGNVTQNLEFGWETSVVTFTSRPEGATVYHENRRLGSGVAVTPFKLEIPEGDYLFEARFSGLPKVIKPVYIEAPQSNQVDFDFNYGAVSVVSDPPGATVVSNGVPVGRTPFNRSVVPVGQHSYSVSMEDYKPVTVSGNVTDGQQLVLSAKLESDKPEVTTRNFTNGVGQRMIWFDSLGGWVADTEILQSVYEMVTKTNPSDIKNPKHPVDSVSWFDASRFCASLTHVEGGLGRLPAGFAYRLPTDSEWSQFAGETSLTNAITSARKRYHSSEPAGSAAPNNYGLYDIRGNLTEWVQDWYSQQILNRAQKEGARVRQEWVGTDRKVLRGGSWLRSTPSDLAIPYRRGGNPSQTDGNDVGFRVVLMPQN